MFFSHNGNIGDLLYSLSFVEEFATFNHEKDNTFFIVKNVKTKYFDKHIYGDVLLNDAAAEYLKPLIEQCQFLSKIEIVEKLPENLEKIFDLTKHKEITINTTVDELRSVYYESVSLHLPKDFSKKLITVKPNFKFKNKILFTISERYNNPLINYKQLEQFKDILVFVGLEKEYELFKEKYFNVEYYKPSSALELAQLMEGSLGFLGNQTGNFAIAEILKIPRILVTCEFMLKDEKLMGGCPNVIPTGGWYEYVRIDEKLPYTIKNLLSR